MVEEVLILIDHILQPTAKIIPKIIKRIPIIIEIMTYISNINTNSIKGNKIFNLHRMIHLMKIIQRRILVLDKLQNFRLIKINIKTNKMLNLRIVLLQDKVQMIILSKIWVWMTYNLLKIKISKECSVLIMSLITKINTIATQKTIIIVLSNKMHKLLGQI